MAKPGWYNENSGRDFPFVFSRDSGGTADYTALKEAPDIIVDFGCVIGILGNVVGENSSVWLHAIRKTGNYVDFEFYSNAGGLLYHKLSFSRELTDNDYEIEYVQATLKEATSLSIPPADRHAPYCEADVLWEGYLVTKNLSKLPFTASPAEQEMTFGDPAFGDPGALSIEPSLVQNLATHYMRTLNVFNANRVRAERVAGCRPWCWANDTYEDYDYFVVDACLSGYVRFAEGYNCVIEEDRLNNKLTIHAQVGQGLGEPPGEILHFPLEEKPQHGNYYDGSVGCDEVVRSINGIEGPHVEIIGGQGVAIDMIPGRHLIIVGVTMQDLTGCFEQEASTSLAEVVPDIDSCACGPES